MHCMSARHNFKAFMAGLFLFLFPLSVQSIRVRQRFFRGSLLYYISRKNTNVMFILRMHWIGTDISRYPANLKAGAGYPAIFFTCSK